jgi:radical SAM superfamily enzyme YgiQ (UPF0313 family)
MTFTTQVSIDIARDAELLQLCRKAGFQGVFIGIETSNAESLAETHKRQNLRVNLSEEVRKIASLGMLVTCGMIVGFDHDDLGIFERLAQFIGELPTPLIQLNVLTAPHATPLYTRLQAEGRLEGYDREGSPGLLHTNIRPKLMSPAQLRIGTKWLINQIYAPSAFADRLEAFGNASEASKMPARAVPVKVIQRALEKRLAAYGVEEQQMLTRLERLTARRPDLANPALKSLMYYAQARYMFEVNGIWDPKLAREGPALAA